MAFLNSNLHCNYFLCKHFVFINNPRCLTMKKENSAFSLRPHCVAWKLFFLCARFFSFGICCLWWCFCNERWTNAYLDMHILLKFNSLNVLLKRFSMGKVSFDIFISFRWRLQKSSKQFLPSLCHECLAGSKSFTIWICIDYCNCCRLNALLFWNCY